MPHRHAQSGFTLIEVLVALAIVGVALAAVMRTMGVMTQNNGLLRERTLALMSADNRLVELTLDPGGKVQTERFACPQGTIAFTCIQAVEMLKTGFRRVTITVFADQLPGKSVATLDRLLPP